MNEFECNRCGHAAEVFLEGSIITKINLCRLNEKDFRIETGTTLPQIKADRIVVKCPVCPYISMILQYEMKEESDLHKSVLKGEVKFKAEVEAIGAVHGDIITVNTDPTRSWQNMRLTSMINKSGFKKLIRRGEIDDITIREQKTIT